MRIAPLQAIRSLAVVGFMLGSVAFGQTAFEIVGVGPNNNNLAGVYTDPYEGTAGVSSVLAYCDDFVDNVTPGESWQALDTNLNQFTATSNVQSVYYKGTTTYSLPSDSSSSSSFPGFSGTYGQTTDYIAAAMLAVQATEILATDPGDTNPADEEKLSDLSFALWGIFDPSLLKQAGNSDGTLSPTDLVNAQNDLASALTSAGSFNSGAAYESSLGGAVINVYTPTGYMNNFSNPDPTADSQRPQEFITVSLPTTGNGIGMPEPSSWATLGLDLFGVGIAGLVFRRKQLRRRS